MTNVNFYNFKSEYNFATNTCGSNKWHALDREGFLEFWKDARYKIKDAYDKSISDEYKYVNYPVIHFRCSDIPFNRHEEYHIPKRSTIIWISDELKKRGYKTAYFLNCIKHLTKNDIHASVCEKLSNLYIEIFKENGIILLPECNSVMKDFYMMVYSPILVSLNPSSFSFMAGISKDPNNYISCDMGIEVNGVYKKQTETDWVTDKNEPVLHRDVKDYKNYDELKNIVYNG